MARKLKKAWKDPVERRICHAVLFGFIAIVLLCVGTVGAIAWSGVE